MANEPQSKEKADLAAKGAALKRIASGDLRLRDLDNISDAEMAVMARTGYTLFTQGRYKDAETIFAGLEALDPREAYYPSALGAIYLAQTKLQEALDALTRALKVDDRHLGSLANRGEVHLRMGQAKAAIPDFEMALKLDPRGDTPFGKRAKVLLTAAKGAGQPKPAAPAAPPAAKPAAKPPAKK
jgi:tetratricopeptide (TPR) repeat protein